VREPLALREFTDPIAGPLLRDPGGRATASQLLALNARGRLAVVAEPLEALTKGEASFAIDATKPRDPVWEGWPP
jgi:hypothetical protein